MGKITKTMLSMLLLISMVCTLSACSANENKDTNLKVNARIATLKGPTGLAMSKLIDDSKNNKTKTNNEITIYGEPSEIVAKLTSGEIDVASLPTNVAATLYQKSNKSIKMASINTLGTIYIVSRVDGINTVNDLKGKKIYATGEGATPEYALDYIIKANGLSESDVEVEYKSEHSELASLLLSRDVDLAMLPEPFVTQVLSKDDSLKIDLDLTKEWDKATEGKSLLTMGCLVARDEFINSNKDAFNAIIDEYKASTEYVVNNVEEAASLSEKYDIMPADVAKKAIPNCNIVFISGDEMQSKTESFLNILFEANPKSVGGTLPDEMFYYKK